MGGFSSAAGGADLICGTDVGAKAGTVIPHAARVPGVESFTML